MKLLPLSFAALLAGCAAPVYQEPPPGVEPHRAVLLQTPAIPQPQTNQPAPIFPPSVIPPALPDRTYYVMGEVRRPGPEPYEDGTTLVQAIEHSVGLTDSADAKRVVVRHADGSSDQYDYSRILSGEAAPPLIQPGDTIEVARKKYIPLRRLWNEWQ